MVVNLMSSMLRVIVKLLDRCATRVVVEAVVTFHEVEGEGDTQEVVAEVLVEEEAVHDLDLEAEAETEDEAHPDRVPEVLVALLPRRNLSPEVPETPAPSPGLLENLDPVRNHHVTLDLDLDPNPNPNHLDDRDPLLRTKTHWTDEDTSVKTEYVV